MAASASGEYLHSVFAWRTFEFFPLPVPGSECLAKTFFGCQPVPATATDRARTHIPHLYYLSGWKPLWRVKVSGETREQEKPKGGWLTAEGARQILGPLGKPVSRQDSRPSGMPPGAAQ